MPDYELGYYEKRRKTKTYDMGYDKYTINEIRREAYKVVRKDNIATVGSISKILKKKPKIKVPDDVKFVNIYRVKFTVDEVHSNGVGAVVYNPKSGAWWMTKKNGKMVFYALDPNGKIWGKPLRRLI